MSRLCPDGNRRDLDTGVHHSVVTSEKVILMPRMNQRLTVLLLSSTETETGFLEDILSKHVALQSARNLEEMLKLLAGGDHDAFLCDWTFYGGTWRDALREVQRRCPELPTIVVCRVGGEREWVEALEAGAFDLLSAPYHDSAVLAVLEHAVASREARTLRFVA